MIKIGITPMDTVFTQKNYLHSRKDHKKLWGVTLRMNHLMNLVQRYHWSKGVQVTKVEETPLTNLVAPADREESASHHFKMINFS